MFFKVSKIMKIFLMILKYLEISENFKKIGNFSIFKNFPIVKNCIFFCSPEVWAENFFQSCFFLNSPGWSMPESIVSLGLSNPPSSHSATTKSWTWFSSKVILLAEREAFRAFSISEILRLPSSALLNKYLQVSFILNNWDNFDVLSPTAHKRRFKSLQIFKSLALLLLKAFFQKLIFFAFFIDGRERMRDLTNLRILSLHFVLF